MRELKIMELDKSKNVRRFVVTETSKQEPWVDFLSPKDVSALSREDRISANQMRRQKAKFEFFKFAFDFLQDSQIDGEYFEFGCHRARTFRMAMSCADFYGYEDSKFFAFDSFDGLPDIGQDTIDQWTPNALTTTVEQFQNLISSSGFDIQKVSIVEGFYSQSLTKKLSSDLLSKGVKSNFINIDCDYYSSARDVLGFVDDFVKHGTVFYLDDVFAGFSPNSEGGVMRAFQEYRTSSKFDFVEFMKIGWWGRSYVAVEKGSGYETWS